MPLNKSLKKVMVIGSGPIVIGQAAEFDYAGTQACRALKEEGLEVVLVNSNPATIMTDSAIADHVYIEPLTLEFVKRIIEKEKPDSILSTLGGQTGLTLSMELAKEGFLKSHNVTLLGASPETIDKAEDRQCFKDTMEAIGEPVIPSKVVTTIEDALDFAEVISYPVIVRPAFTLGGTGGGIAANKEELYNIAEAGIRLSPINQILVEKCISGWKEIEFEVMRDAIGNEITVCSMENFDPVGVHTGDSIVIAPAVTLADKEYQMLRSAALNIIQAMGIEGGCNGTMRFDVITHGVAAHSARAWMGKNAIHAAAEILNRLNAHENRAIEVDGLTYQEGLNATLISGGKGTNVIPDECRVHVNYRFAPDKSLAEAKALMIGADAGAKLGNGEHQATGGVFEGFGIEMKDESPSARPGLNSPLAQSLVSLVKERTGRDPLAKLGWTDVARFAILGIPAVNLGAGSPLLAHKQDEQLPETDLLLMADLLEDWLR